MRQSCALDILKSGQNVFLTGSAGAGKTYTLNQYIHYLRARKVSVAVTASTGIAATHMSGTTIHSWSGIGIRDELSDRDLAQLAKNPFLTDRIKDTAVLIIDEISMLHAKQLNAVNAVLKHIRKTSEPFGGIQIVVAGDFFQLPPIGSREETNRDKFAFMSEAWLEAGFNICYLSEQHRQVSEDTAALSLDDILNQIRRQQVTLDAIQALEATYHHDIDANRTRLYTHNLNVNTINDKELAALSGDSLEFQASLFGDKKLIDTLKKTVRTQDELTLKVGAKVMFIKNNNETGVSNGTMGELVGFSKVKLQTSESSDKPSKNSTEDKTADKKTGDKKTDDKQIKEDEKAALENNSKTAEPKTQSAQKLPVVRLNCGREVIAEPEEWVIEDEHGEVLASYVQVPLCLAWAITVHKSQGMTLEAAEIDLSRTFELGQGYVALSRLKSLSGLRLLGLNDMSLQLDPLARGADKRFLALSEDAETRLAKIDAKDLSQTQKNFIIKSGGITNKAAIASYEKLQKKRRDQQKLQQKKQSQKNQLNDKSISTLDITRQHLLDKMSIQAIAEARGLAQSTIMRHIKDIHKQQPTLDLAHLMPESAVMRAVETAYHAIKAANNPNDFHDDGNIKIKPIYEALDAAISYNLIRLVLIFIAA